MAQEPGCPENDRLGDGKGMKNMNKELTDVVYMMTSCLLRIHSLRFFDGGLHEVPVEEVMTVALIAIFIFVPCLWLVRYLKDKRLDSDEKDKFIQIHIISTIVLTIAGGVFARMFGLVNKWIDEQPLIIAVYIALALSSFGIIVGKMIDFWVYCLRKKMF